MRRGAGGEAMSEKNTSENQVMITKADEKKSITIANIVQTSVDRSPKDIASYKAAVGSAESVYYPVRAALYDLYKKIEIDGSLTGAWEIKRIAKVRNKILKFKKNGKVDEAFDALIEGGMFRDFITLIMQQKAWGLSGAEFIPGNTFKWVEVPRKHIRPHLRKITKHQYGDEGINYEDLWNVVVLGGQNDFGFFYKIVPIILYRQGNWGDWAQFIERYGLPFQVYEYDIYDEATRQQAFDMARNAGGNLAIVIPKQLAFRTEDAKQVNGDGKLQGNFNDALEKQIVLTVLGNLETTNAGGGSLAKAKVQALDQSDVIADDMKDVLDVLNSAQFQNILQSYGYNVTGGRFEYEIVADPEALKAEVEIDKFLVSDVKLPLAHDFFYEKYGRPKPENYDELVKQMEEKEKPNAERQMQNAEEDVQKEKSNSQKKALGTKHSALSTKLSFWDKIDLRIANFFDPGHKG